MLFHPGYLNGDEHAYLHSTQQSLSFTFRWNYLSSQISHHYSLLHLHYSRRGRTKDRHTINNNSHRPHTVRRPKELSNINNSSFRYLYE